MPIHSELLSMLKELIPFIKGPWFLGDGALLGIVRDKHLIPYDDDLDIYLLPGSFIDIDNLCNSSLMFQKYYDVDKIYREDNEPVKKNSWLDYCGLIKGKNKRLNRPQVMSLAGQTYPEEKKQVKFTMPWIDVFHLYIKQDQYYIKNEIWSELFFTKNEIDSIGDDTTLGFPIKIPHNNKGILKRFYGDDWDVPNPQCQQRVKYSQQKIQ